MKIPILIHKPGALMLVTTLLWSICPSVIANQFKPALGEMRFAQRLFYPALLLTVVAWNSYLFGIWPLLPSLKQNSALALLLGLAAGSASIVLEILMSRRRKQWQAAGTLLQRNPAEQFGGIVGFYGPETVRTWEHSARSSAANDLSLFELMSSALLEEILYRYYLIALLSSLGASLALSVAISSISYGLIHSYFGINSVVSKTVSGFLYAALVLLTGNLAASIVAHSLVNLAAFSFIRMQKTARAAA